MKKIFLSLILVAVLLTGCSSPEPIGEVKDKFQTPSTVEKESFKASRTVIDNAFQKMDLASIDIFDSCDIYATEELYEVNLVMNEEHYTNLYLNQGRLKEKWDETVESFRDITIYTKDHFTNDGFGTDVTLNVINPINQSLALLIITNDEVVYDFTKEA